MASLLLLGYTRLVLAPARPLPEPAPVLAPAPAPALRSLPSPAAAPVLLREDEPLPPLDLRAAEAEPHPFDASTFRLSNGLELIVVEDHSSPVIAAQVVFRVGAAHDPPDQLGSAHLLEHLLLHGTRRLGTTSWTEEAPRYELMRELTAELAQTDDPAQRLLIEEDLALVHQEADQHGIPGELQRLLAELGAKDVNASTSLDSTRYVATIPPEKLLPWAVALAEQLSDPVLRAFVNEREVVHEELALRSNHCAASWEDVRQALYEGHPYARPIGGTPDDLARVHIGSLEALFDRGYGPGNAAVVLVGDLDPHEARQIVEDTFGRWQPRPARVPELTEPGPVPSVVRLSSGKEGHVLLGWQLGALGPGDAQALRVLSSAISQRLDSARAVVYTQVTRQQLRNGSVLVIDAWCKDTLPCERQILDAVR
jgi:predicted Zn-dependent peptidase